MDDSSDASQGRCINNGKSDSNVGSVTKPVMKKPHLDNLTSNSQATREEILSLFSEYGPIAHMDFPEKKSYCGPQHKGFARIAFKNEADAKRVWAVSQEERIKYSDHSGSHVMMITLASENYSPIDKLPDNCFHEIFLNLYSLQDKIALDLVCKRWKTVGKESWSNITKVRGRQEGYPPWKVTLARAGSSLRAIFISLKKDTAQLLSLLIEHCANLEEIDINLPEDFTQFIPQLQSFFEKNQRLRRLQVEFTGRVVFWKSDADSNREKFTDISFMEHVSATLEEIHFTKIGGARPPLSPLELSRFQNLRVIEILDHEILENNFRGIENLHNLEKIKIHDCKIHPSNIERITHLKKLKYLSIAECQITDPILSEILRNNKALKYLNISGINGITDSSFMYVQQLPELQVLSMNSLPKITDTYLCQMPKLRALACNDSPITGEGLLKFLKTASSIEKIFVYYCPVSLDSISNVRKWTKRTGRPLRLFLDDIKASDFFRKVRNRSQGLLNIDCREVACEEEDPMTHDWADDLVD